MSKALIRACSGRRPYVLPHRYAVEIVEGGGLVKPRGILFIRLVEAQNVPKTDLFSKTDCYARCCLCESEHQTLAACLISRMYPA